MNAPPTLIGLAAFMKRYCPACRTWPREVLLSYLGWFWRDGRIGILQVDGRIVAAALVRCVNDIAEADQQYFHDEQAKIAWVDDIVSRHPLGVPALFKMAMHRLGPREAFAGKVFNRDGELRMLPWEFVERLTLRASTHGLTIHSSATRAREPIAS